MELQKRERPPRGRKIFSTGSKTPSPTSTISSVYMKSTTAEQGKEALSKNLTKKSRHFSAAVKNGKVLEGYSEKAEHVPGGTFRAYHRNNSIKSDQDRSTSIISDAGNRTMIIDRGVCINSSENVDNSKTLRVSALCESQGVENHDKTVLRDQELAANIKTHGYTQIPKQQKKLWGGGTLKRSSSKAATNPGGNVKEECEIGIERIRIGLGEDHVPNHIAATSNDEVLLIDSSRQLSDTCCNHDNRSCMKSCKINSSPHSHRSLEESNKGTELIYCDHHHETNEVMVDPTDCQVPMVSMHHNSCRGTDQHIESSGSQLTDEQGFTYFSSQDKEVFGPRPMDFFHVLIHQHAKTLVALQDLRQEVSTLKEFRSSVLTSLPQLSNGSGSPPSGNSTSVRAPNQIWWSNSGTSIMKSSPAQCNKCSGDSSSSSSGPGAVHKNLIDSGFSTETTKSSSTAAAGTVKNLEDCCLGSPSAGSSSSQSGGGGDDPLSSLLDLIQQKVIINNQLKLVGGFKTVASTLAAPSTFKKNQLGRLDSICCFNTHLTTSTGCDNKECSIKLMDYPVEPAVLKAVLQEVDHVELQRQILFAFDKVQMLESNLKRKSQELNELKGEVLRQQMESEDEEEPVEDSLSSGINSRKRVEDEDEREEDSLTPSPPPITPRRPRSGHQYAKEESFRRESALSSENEQLRFKLKEQEILLEATKAKLRILERQRVNEDHSAPDSLITSPTKGVRCSSSGSSGSCNSSRIPISLRSSGNTPENVGGAAFLSPNRIFQRSRKSPVLNGCISNGSQNNQMHGNMGGSSNKSFNSHESSGSGKISSSIPVAISRLQQQSKNSSVPSPTFSTTITKKMGLLGRTNKSGSNALSCSPTTTTTSANNLNINHNGTSGSNNSYNIVSNKPQTLSNVLNKKLLANSSTTGSSSGGTTSAAWPTWAQWFG